MLTLPGPLPGEEGDQDTCQTVHRRTTEVGDEVAWQIWGAVPLSDKAEGAGQ